MSTEETPVESTDLDLDSFSADFFGQKTDTPEPASPEEPSVDEDVESDAPEQEDTHPEADTLENEDEDTEEVEEEQTPKPKKTRFQERIDELTSKAREAERREAELQKKLDALIEKLSPEAKDTPVSTAPDQFTGPSPTDLNADGSEKYPLGEFDPSYIRDLTKHTLKVESEAMNKAREEQAANEKAAREAETQKEALAANWNEKLEPAKERYPDFQEKGENLLETFDGIPQAYGEYLTGTLMAMDYGPDVLYYLANNVDEAKKIVAMGAQKATIALGRIEAKFAQAEAEKQTARPKVTNAPAPPTHQNKGSSPAKPSIPADTDDLDAFEKSFFKTRR